MHNDRPWNFEGAMVQLTRLVVNSILIVCLLILLLPLSANAYAFAVSHQEAKQLAIKIWRNEGNNNLKNIMVWNQGEEFPSLGIGHFIWLPKNYHGPFVATFPDFLRYARQHGATLPTWIEHRDIRFSPWNSALEFSQTQSTKAFKQLKSFLVATRELQAQFIIDCFNTKLTQAINALSPSQQHVTKAKIKALTKTSLGRYALIDYANFKGFGDNERERYAEQGWGLLQVLETMTDDRKVAATDRFADAAIAMLRMRVKNSPPERHERRWLVGWIKRVKTYRDSPSLRGTRF